MDWKSHFADRASLVRSSTVRDFLKLAGQSGIISFAGGLPDPQLLPVEHVRAASDAVLSHYGSQVLQYGETQGLEQLRAAIAARFGTPTTNPDNVLITTGSQQALDLIGRVFLDESSLVLTQNPTYLSALAAWRPLGASFHPLDLGARTQSYPPVKLGYVIPNFQNPTGATLSHSEREALVDLAIGRRLPIIEDDPYGELRFEGTPLPSLQQLAGGPPGPIISVGSLSKLLAPGLRLGWIIADTQLIDILVRAKQALDLHTSTLSQFIALQLLEQRTLEEILPRLTRGYAAKRDALVAAIQPLERQGVRWRVPEGGMFLFLVLPEAVDGRQLARCALNHCVLVVPGSDFHIDNTGANTLRLNFTHPELDKIAEGAARLANTLTELSADCGVLASSPVTFIRPKAAHSHS